MKENKSVSWNEVLYIMKDLKEEVTELKNEMKEGFKAIHEDNREMRKTLGSHDTAVEVINGKVDRLEARVKQLEIKDNNRNNNDGTNWRRDGTIATAGGGVGATILGFIIWFMQFLQ